MVVKVFRKAFRIVCLTIVTLILMAMFRPHCVTAVLHQATVLIYLDRLFIPRLPQRTTEGSVSSSNNTNNSLDRNPQTMSKVRDTPITNNHSGTKFVPLWYSVNQHCCLMKTYRVPSKHCNQYQSENRETND